MTMYTKEYCAWKNANQKVEHLDKVIFFAATRLTEKILYEQITEKKFDKEDENLNALRDTLGKYVEEKLKIPFQEIRCDEVNADFLDGYKLFLKSKNIHSNTITTRLRLLRKLMCQANQLGISDFCI